MRDKTGIEEDIDKTITDVQRENCAGDDGGKTLLADNQGTMKVGWTVLERLVIASVWRRTGHFLSVSWSAVLPNKGQPASLT